jgi:hypothetical protein
LHTKEVLMAADDVALAWVRIHDDETRQRVTEGDLSALGELGLNPEEESLVRRLAEEGVSSEVEAFETSGFFAALNYSYGKLSKPVLEQVQAQLDEDDEVSGYGYRQAIAAWRSSGLTQHGGSPWGAAGGIEIVPQSGGASGPGVAHPWDFPDDNPSGVGGSCY